MRLLFDQNLSPLLVEGLKEIFPDSLHVQTIELGSANDNEIWEFAKGNGFTVVTKDADFAEKSLIDTSSPKIIWIRKGNCSTKEIENLIVENLNEIHALGNSNSLNVLNLY